MTPLISIIVPVYNVEDYLNDCLNSVIAQSYKNLEIVLVDDGSKDSSGKMCDDFASKDSRITVIHKNNTGVSDSRNYALSLIHGEYYCFSDSDDVLHQDYVKHMYETIVKYDADIATCAYLYAWKDGTKKRTKNADIPDDYACTDKGITALSEMLYNKKYVPSCCGKLFNKEKTGIIHFEEFATGEDVLASTDFYANAEKVAFSNMPLYYYMQNDKSVMHTFDEKKTFDIILTGDEIYKRVLKRCPQIKRAAAYYVIEKNLMTLMQFEEHKIDNNKTDHIKDNLKKYRNTVISDKNAQMRTRAACLMSYLGFGFLCKVRNMMNR